MRIGIDLGGTKIAAGLVDRAGRVILKQKIATEQKRGYKGVKESLVGLVKKVIEESGVVLKDIERIGVAAAGQIDKNSMKIIFSPNLGWRNVPLKKDIETTFGIETFVENDVNAATYGEWRFGLKGIPKDTIGIFVGTGIGGGLIFDGKLYRGFSNVGGELGHITVNPYGYRCHCGNTGCFEACCGGSYVVERVKVEIVNGYKGKIWDILGGDPDLLTTSHIEEGCLLGDSLCRKVWTEVIEYMGAAMASLVNLLNPGIIILGGGVVYGSKYLVEQVRAVMEVRAMKASLKGLKIEKARLGEDAGIIGAAFVE
jgi:glucokinase